MPNPGLAAGSFFLGGQLQGQQALQMQQQMMQERLMDEQMKRAQLMVQFQQLQRQQDAISKLPPEQQQAYALGANWGDIQKRNDLQGRVAFAQQRLLQDKSLSDQQKIAYLQKLNTGSVGDVTKLLDELEKPQKPTLIDLFYSGELGAYEKVAHSADKANVTNLNVNMPTSPEMLMPGTGGDRSHPVVMEHSKTGELSKVPAPAGVEMPPLKGEEAAVDAYKKAHPGIRDDIARAAVKAEEAAAVAKAKPPEASKIPAPKDEIISNGWKMRINRKSGLYGVEGMAAIPDAGLAGAVGLGKGADPRLMEKTALTQAHIDNREIYSTGAGKNKTYYVKGDDGEWYRLTKNGQYRSK